MVLVFGFLFTEKMKRNWRLRKKTKHIKLPLKKEEVTIQGIKILFLVFLLIGIQNHDLTWLLLLLLLLLM